MLPGGPPRRLVTGAAWLAVVATGVAAMVLSLLPQPAAAPARQVVASLPYWNVTRGGGTVLANRADFTEVSPWMYGLSGRAGIGTQYGPGQARAVAAELTRLRGAGLRIVPTLANVTGGRWAYQPAARILHRPALREAHIAAIVALARRHHYAGIDIDYEDLRAGDRQAFTDFITRLAAALHAAGKVLSVAVFAKISNAGVDQRNLAQDYAAIGHAADQVRIMAYGYHWGSSAPGPVAPIGWVRRVLRYAQSQIPAHKIILGVPLYGYDWSGGHGVPVSWLRVRRIAARYHVRPHYDTASQAPWLRYTDQAGHRHVVWFENEASSLAKFGAAAGSRIGGVFLWMFGPGDTGTWAALRRAWPAPAQESGGQR